MSSGTRAPRKVGPREPRSTVAVLAVVVVVVFAAIAVRAVYYRQLADSPYATALLVDEELYDERARAIAGGDWRLGDRPYYQDPLYPYVLAVVYRLAGHDLGIVRVLQMLAGTLAAVAVCSVAWRAAGPIAGAAAGLLFAASPNVLFYEGHIEKTALSVALVSLSLLLGVRAAVPRTRGISWSVLGCSIGLLALLRGNFLALVPLAALAAGGRTYTASSRPGARERLAESVRGAGLLVLGAAIAILPFSLRNLAVSGEPVLVTSQSGQNFYIGNWSGNDTGMYVAPAWVRPHPRHEEVDFARAAQRATGRRLTAREISRHYWDLGLAEIRRRPGRFVRLTALRLGWALHPQELPDNYDLRFVGRFVPLLAALPGASVMLALGLPGLALGAIARRPGIRLVVGYVALYLASVIPFFVFGRYRAPILPALAVGAGVLIAIAWRALVARQFEKLAAGAGLVLVAGLALHALPAPPNQDGQNWNNLGTVHEARADSAGALAAYREATARGNPLGSYNEGRLLVAAGRLEDALVSYRRSLELLPERPESHANLGACLLNLERDAEAVAALERAVTLDSTMAEAWYNLGVASERLGRIGPAVAQLRQAARIAGGASPLGRRAQLRAARIESRGTTSER